MSPKGTKTETEPKAGNLEELWKLVDGIETAMLTTRRAEGDLVSRPMATQTRAPGADSWVAPLRDLTDVRRIGAGPRSEREGVWRLLTGRYWADYATQDGNASPGGRARRRWDATGSSAPAVS